MEYHFGDFHNKFNGEIPQNLSSSISVFDISYNQFMVEFRIVAELIANNSYLNGSIPQELTTLSNLERLLRDQNHLKGSLPFD